MSDRHYGADEHNADYERGSEAERAAIVAWLNTGCAADWWMAPDFAEAIENGDHLRGDDE